MNVASLELCKELYELSGWKPDLAYDWFIADVWQVRPLQEWIDEGYTDSIAAYDLGYLLRKLPHTTLACSTEREAESRMWTIWNADPRDLKPSTIPVGYTRCYGEVPENAAAALAIEFFKQGVLTKAGDAKD